MKKTSSFTAILVAVGLLFASVSVSAKETIDPVQFCIAQAANNLGIDTLILQVLHDVEGGKVGQAVKNTNGSFDLGPMQINTIWLPELKERFGITKNDLQNDVCTNVYVAAWIFSSHYKQTHEVATALARYHSKTPKFQARYLHALSKALDRRMAAIQRAAGKTATSPAPVAAGVAARPLTTLASAPN